MRAHRVPTTTVTIETDILTRGTEMTIDETVIEERVGEMKAKIIDGIMGAAAQVNMMVGMRIMDVTRNVRIMVRKEKEIAEWQNQREH